MTGVRDLLALRVLVLDGAYATLLQRAPALTPSAVHHAYLEAGADIISTPTFLVPGRHAAFEAARAARAAADAWSARTPERPRLVAGAMGPLGEPGGTSRRNRYRETIGGVMEGGADLLLLETITDTATMRDWLEAVRQEGQARGTAPVLWLSAAVTKGGRLPGGEPITAFVSAALEHPVLALGLNCGTGARDTRAHIETLARLAPGAVVSWHPSAGLPDAFGHYDESPELLGAIVGDAARAGLVQIVGGCCGTTPDHIRAIAEAIDQTPEQGQLVE